MCKCLVACLQHSIVIAHVCGCHWYSSMTFETLRHRYITLWFSFIPPRKTLSERSVRLRDYLFSLVSNMSGRIRLCPIMQMFPSKIMIKIKHMISSLPKNFPQFFFPSIQTKWLFCCLSSFYQKINCHFMGVPAIFWWPCLSSESNSLQMSQFGVTRHQVNNHRVHSTLEKRCLWRRWKNIFDLQMKILLATDAPLLSPMGWTNCGSPTCFVRLFQLNSNISTPHI